MKIRATILTILMWSLSFEICAEPTLSGEEQVLEKVEEFTIAWAEKEDPELLRNIFHDRIVSITPSVREPIHGANENIEAYKKFLESVEIVDSKFTNKTVNLYNNQHTAVVTLQYEVDMKFGNSKMTSVGRDMLILVKENGKWEIVADQYSSFPKE